MNDSPKTSVSVAVPSNTFTPNNTAVYLILPDINSVMSTAEPALGGSGYTAATNTIKLISEGQSDVVPAGMNYKLVVVANVNGVYYYYETTGIITRDIVIPVSMVVVSGDEIKTKLGAL
jgi:uncharacterized protein (UPF0333 family)